MIKKLFKIHTLDSYFYAIAESKEEIRKMYENPYKEYPLIIDEIKGYEIKGKSIIL